MRLLVHALEVALSRERHQRRAVEVGVRHSGHEVESAGAERAETYAGVAGEAAADVGHVGAALLVANRDELDRASATATRSDRGSPRPGCRTRAPRPRPRGTPRRRHWLCASTRASDCNVTVVAPVARYAKSGDMHIAYTVEGEGPVDLVWIPPWISQVEYLWSEASLERVMARLTRFARVITFDRRGSGLSDPLLGAPTLEEQMDDVLAVMDAAGSESAAIWARSRAGRWPRCSPRPSRNAPRPSFSTPRCPRHLGAGLRVGVDRGNARRPHGRAARALGRGLGGRLGRAEPQERPVLHGVGRAPRAAGREPRDDPPHLRSDRRASTCATCCPRFACRRS